MTRPPTLFSVTVILLAAAAIWRGIGLLVAADPALAALIAVCLLAICCLTALATREG